MVSKWIISRTWLQPIDPTVTIDPNFLGHPSIYRVTDVLVRILIPWLAGQSRGQGSPNISNGTIQMEVRNT